MKKKLVFLGAAVLLVCGLVLFGCGGDGGGGYTELQGLWARGSGASEQTFNISGTTYTFSLQAGGQDIEVTGVLSGLASAGGLSGGYDAEGTISSIKVNTVEMTTNATALNSMGISNINAVKIPVQLVVDVDEDPAELEIRLLNGREGITPNSTVAASIGMMDTQNGGSYRHQ